MTVDWKEPVDVQRLRELVATETNAKQRDRYRVVLIAGEGLGEQRQLDREQIAAAVGRSRQFVDQWVGRYRKGGVETLTPKRQPGAKPKLTVVQQQELCAMLDTGPAPEEGLAAYNGPILRCPSRQPHLHSFRRGRHHVAIAYKEMSDGRGTAAEFGSGAVLARDDQEA